MTVKIYVFDTSYLLELSDCGRDVVPAARDHIRKMFQTAAKAGARFVVPLPCLFELGDHIADVRHEKKRNELAEWLLHTVKSSLEDELPWIITPAGDPKEVLPPLLSRFKNNTVKKQVGLVDTFTAQEAQRLKKEYRKMKAVVHVWTNDRALKALEPDKEVDAYFW
jgi:hypothetical protein